MDGDKKVVDILKGLLIEDQGQKSLRSLVSYDMTALDHMLQSRLDIGAWNFCDDDQPTLLKVLTKLGGDDKYKYVTKGKDDKLFYTNANICLIVKDVMPKDETALRNYEDKQLAFFWYLKILQDGLGVDLSFLWNRKPWPVVLTPRFMGLLDVFVLNAMHGYSKLMRKNNWKENDVFLRELVTVRELKWSRLILCLSHACTYVFYLYTYDFNFDAYTFNFDAYTFYPNAYICYFDAYTL